MSLIVVFYHPDSDQLGIDWGGLIQGIANVAPAAIASVQMLTTPRPQGLQGSGLIDHLFLNELRPAQAAHAAGQITTAQMMQVAVAIQQTLNTHPGRWDNPTYLADAKRWIGDEIARIQGLQTSPPQQQPVTPAQTTVTGTITQPATQQPVAGILPATIAGFDTTTVLIALAAGFGVAWILKR